jgi:hypothetical protein
MAPRAVEAGGLGCRIRRYEDFQVTTSKASLGSVKIDRILPFQGLDESAILGSGLVARKMVATDNKDSTTHGMWYRV